MARFNNNQVIDGADTCAYPIFQATKAEFAVLFPKPWQETEPAAINPARRRLFGQG